MAESDDPRFSLSKRVLRRRAVEEITGLSRSTIYARMSAGMFPMAVGLGGRSVGWLADEIDAWIVSRVAESRRG